MAEILNDRDDLKGGIDHIEDKKRDQKGHGFLRVEIGIGDDENQQDHDLHPKNSQETLGELFHLQVTGPQQGAVKSRIDQVKNHRQKRKKKIKRVGKQKPESQKTQPINEQGQVDQLDQKGSQGLCHNNRYSLVKSRMA